MRWQPSDIPFTFAFMIRNLFDYDAREPSLNNGATVNLPNDLPLTGRTIYGELRYQF